jgi:hypothetical protein
MSCFRTLLLALPLAWAGASVAQDGKDGKDEPKKEPAKASNEVEVRFADGSSVRMAILQESIDIVTKFGKLSVPMAEVRKIELGVHLPEGTLEKIQAAMKKLNSEVFREREEAVNQLVQLGPHAYPTLHAASKSTDPETAQRVEAAIKKIKAKFKEEALQLRVSDRIVTGDFPIVGRIVSPTIKAQTPIFGALDLKLPELRTIVWLTGNSDVEFLVDATKYCNSRQWMETSVMHEGGNALKIEASGEVDLLPGNGPEFISGPQGNFNIGGRFGPRNQWVPGQLLGKIGEGGTPFVVGERYNGSPGQNGKLYLQIVPGNFGGPGGGGAQGSYKVKVSSGIQ